MEKQRNFPWKSTRFVVISLTLSFSLVLLSFLFFWAIRASPLIHREAYMLLSTSSLNLSFNSLNLQSLTGGFTDLPASSANYTNLTNTQFEKPQISSGFVYNSSIKVSVSNREEVGCGNSTNVEEGNDVGFIDFDANISVDRVKSLNFEGTHLRKPQNSSGFSKSTIFNGEDGEVVAEGAEDDGRSSYEISRQENEPNLTSVGKVDEKIEEKKAKYCDISKGMWVFDESYPLYTNFSCPFIDEGFNCQGNGRLDKDYMKWKWQPQDCEIPRFNATNMLELIRGKRLVFAGDSINRNQWESLLCLLMAAVKDPKKVYETRGRRITKQKGAYSFRFVEIGGVISKQKQGLTITRKAVKCILILML